MSFHPYPTRSGFIFFGVGMALSVVAIWVVNALLALSEWASRFNLLIGLLLLLALIAISFYLSLVAFKVDYQLNRNGLAIRWGLSQQRVPMSAIENIQPGREIFESTSFKGVNVDGFHLGWGNLANGSPLQFYATAPVTHSLLVVTANRNYMISPHQPDDFLKAWHVRRELGPTQLWSADRQFQWPLNIPLITDRLIWGLLGIAALLCLALLGYISLNYADFSPSLPVHFNALGRADRIANKSTLFLLPAVGAIVWLLNVILGSIIYRREKVGAYLLWGSSVVTQLCLWVAVLMITG